MRQSPTITITYKTNNTVRRKKSYNQIVSQQNGLYNRISRQAGEETNPARYNQLYRRADRVSAAGDAYRRNIRMLNGARRASDQTEADRNRGYSRAEYTTGQRARRRGAGLGLANG